MDLDRYTIFSSQDGEVYKFISYGRKGRIIKVIQFVQIENTNIYNLSLGDLNEETGKIDYLSISDNGDGKKVLATVAFAALLFTQIKQGIYVYARGNTKSRTRLYRMGISNYYNEIVKHFDIYGLVNDIIKRFEIGVDYDAFLVKRK